MIRGRLVFENVVSAKLPSEPGPLTPFEFLVQHLRAEKTRTVHPETQLIDDLDLVLSALERHGLSALAFLPNNIPMGT